MDDTDKIQIDPELDAMNKTYFALRSLDQKAQERIISWLINKFSIESASTLPIEEKNKTLSYRKDAQVDGEIDYSIFPTPADFLSKCNTISGVEKTLAIATYIQEKNKKEELTGYEINKALTHIGHKVANITTTINVLSQRKPQLMIQTHKGPSTMARKNYKVTAEGIKEVKNMLSRVVKGE